jgi:Na+-driven multidrug efflux pump
VPRLRNHAHLPALVTYLLQVGVMAGVAFVVARTTGDTAVAAIADALAGASLIIGIPMALLTAVYWRSLRNVATDRPSQGSNSGGRAGRDTLEEPP